MFERESGKILRFFLRKIYATSEKLILKSFQCIHCNGIAYFISLDGAIEKYKCSSCESIIDAIPHYIEKPFPLEINHYRATVPVSNNIEARKAAIKIRKLFSGMTNFIEGDLHKQILQAQPVLDLGIYSENEMKRLSNQAKEIGLDLEFIFLPEDSY
ncbi:MAG TPA: hypothetical protein VJ752_16210 [Burkholderiaceae bacterium]|nr:hypothetical protein [Burkholderiaceae bacterium]